MYDRNIVFHWIMSELGAGKRGASLGIDALKFEALNQDLDTFTRYPEVNIRTHNINTDGHSSEYAINIEALYRQVELSSEVLKKSFAAKDFPFIISGDHFSAGGTIAAHKAAFPDKRLGVIWVDAHGDLHTPYTTPSGNMHGMPLGFSLDIKPDENANPVDDATVELWEKLCNLGNVRPKIDPKDLVFIDIRQLERCEWRVLDHFGIRNYPPDKLKSLGVAELSKDVNEYLEHCDDIYISFDVDFMDEEIAQGTGTPVSNGLSEEQATELLANLWRNPKVCAIEMVEINPLLDIRNRTAKIVLRIIQKLLSL